MSSFTTLKLAVVIEIAEVRAIKSVTDNLDVLLLVMEILLAEGAHDVGAEGRVDEDGLVDLRHVVARSDRPDGLEHAERMALLEQLVEISLVERTDDDEDDVVDHVPVCDVVKEGRKWLDRIEFHVLEFIHKLFSAIIKK